MLDLQFRNLRREEIEQIWTIDRREVIERMYRIEDGELRLREEYHDVQGWPPNEAAEITPWLYEIFDRGGVFYAAFDGRQIVGVSGLDTIWRGPRRDLLQLPMMHVSRDYRAHGVGGMLFEKARDSARERNARGLYISATPSENTIRFYMSHGGTVLARPDPELLAREPEDIHLECAV